jgi:hypothetical protein
MTEAAHKPTVRTFAAIGGFEAIARGVTLSVYPLTLYRAWGDAVVVSKIYFAVGILSLAMVAGSAAAHPPCPAPLRIRWACCCT